MAVSARLSTALLFAALALLTPPLQAQQLPSLRGGEQDMRTLAWAEAIGRHDVAHLRALLVKMPADFDVNYADMSGRTALMSAAWKGDIALLQVLLERGADPAALAYDGSSLLHFAAASPDPQGVALLLQAGAPAMQRNGLGQSALSVAVSQGHVSSARILLQYAPAALTMADMYGITPLMLAAQQGDMALLELLLAEGDSDTLLAQRDDLGNSALLLALLKGQRLAALRLLEAGADSDVENRDGITVNQLMHALAQDAAS